MTYFDHLLSGLHVDVFYMCTDYGRGLEQKPTVQDFSISILVRTKVYMQ
jgi:hypothetical protein